MRTLTVQRTPAEARECERRARLYAEQVAHRGHIVTWGQRNPDAPKLSELGSALAMSARMTEETRST